MLLDLLDWSTFRAPTFLPVLTPSKSHAAPLRTQPKLQLYFVYPGPCINVTIYYFFQQLLTRQQGP